MSVSLRDIRTTTIPSRAHRGIIIACGSILAITAAGSVGHADTLHGFCYGSTPACLDNGTNTPTSTSSPQFGFISSPAGASGTFYVDFLAPSNEASGPISVTVNGTTTVSATLFSSTPWSSGQLDSYLGISAAPTNPIGAFLPSTQSLDPGATGYLVYTADLGTYTLSGNSSPMSGPLLSLNGSLSLGSYLVGFVDTGSDTFSATANSGAIFETSTPPPSPPPSSVPEPSSLMLFGTGLLGIAEATRRRLRR